MGGWRPFRLTMDGDSGTEGSQGSGRIAHASIRVRPGATHTFVQRTIEWLTELSGLATTDAALLARIQIAVAELVENVAKYGTCEDGRVAATVERREGGRRYLRLETSNGAPPEHIVRVARLLDQLRDAEDPMAFYDELISCVAPRRETGVSGLGLARIWAEGDLKLDYRVDGDRLTLVVETPLEAAERAGE